MRFIVVAAGLLALVGCKSSEERAAAAATQDDAYCQSLGARPGDPAYVQCRLVSRSERDEKRRLAWKAVGDGLGEMGNNLQRNAAANRSVNCTSTNSFGTTYTNCN